MPKTYRNPPIIEAVCEFRFELSGKPSEKQIATFYEKIKSSFPVSKKGKVGSIELKVESDKSSGKNQMTHKENFYDFDQYFSQDEKYSVQLDGGRVSIHRIKPYISWTDFSPLIKLVYNSYIKSFTPIKVIRIGLRYVNGINFPAEQFIFSDYFNVKFSFPSLVEKNQKSIFIGSVFEQEKGRDAIKVQLVEKQGTQVSERAFVLDFDYFLTTPFITSDKVEKWIEEAHNNLEEVFESVVSDKTRILFDK
ncbi:MAG: TIGR04255 family protein [Patescibacteria group bacterium]